MRELHDLVALRRAAPLMAIAISAGSKSGRIRPVPVSGRLVQAALALAFATWLEIASIKAGDRQS
jgi:hypothetical protein